MGTVFTRRFEADRIGSQVPIKLMHLEGLYELFVSKFVSSCLLLFNLIFIKFSDVGLHTFFVIFLCCFMLPYFALFYNSAMIQLVYQLGLPLPSLAKGHLEMK